GMAHLARDRLRQMPLAVRILDQDHLAGADGPRFAVARGDAHAGVEVDDVLPPRRRMPIEVVVASSLAKDDARRRQAARQFPSGYSARPTRSQRRAGATSRWGRGRDWGCASESPAGGFRLAPEWRV